MHVGATPSDLDAAAAVIAAQAARLEALIVVARLDAAAESLAGTPLGIEAASSATKLRLAIFTAQLSLSSYAARLDHAAARYRHVEASVMRGPAP